MFLVSIKFDHYMKNQAFILSFKAVPHNVKESIFDRPARKEAFGEIDKNQLHNHVQQMGKPSDKFVVASKENPVAANKKEISKKVRLTEEFIEFESSYAANCSKRCHVDPSVLSAEFAYMHFDMDKAIENARNIDDFAGEREIMERRIKKGTEEDKAMIFSDLFNKFESEDQFKGLLDDVNDLLVLPSDEPTPKKPKQPKFKIFEDEDIPDFVPISKKNKRAFALRRL